MENLYAMTEEHNENLVAFIEELEEKMPRQIHVTSLTAGEDVISLNIEVESKEAMATIIQQLRTFRTLDTISVGGAQDQTDDSGLRKVSFSVTCTYRTLAELEAEANLQETQE